jgi:hypothetical protein
LSHIVSIQTQIKDPAALAAACRRLGLAPPTQGKALIFSTEAEGLLVQLPDWRYPAVVDTSAGAIQFDTYGGRWGAQIELDKLLQAYAIEKTRLEARRSGHSLTELRLPDGSVKLTLQMGGAA